MLLEELPGVSDARQLNRPPPLLLKRRSRVGDKIVDRVVDGVAVETPAPSLDNVFLLVVRRHHRHPYYLRYHRQMNSFPNRSYLYQLSKQTVLTELLGNHSKVNVLPVLLSEGRDINVSQIAEQARMSRSTVYDHIEDLQAMEVVE